MTGYDDHLLGFGGKQRAWGDSYGEFKLNTVKYESLAGSAVEDRHVIYTLGSRRLETVDDSYYVAPGAQVIGSVRLGREASVWFNAVLRGDNDWLIIGDGSNVQDGTVIHTDPGLKVEVGSNVTIGHMAFLHGCTVGDGSLIANGAMVLDRARIGRNCLIAAGALVTPGKEIPDGSVVMGSPGNIVRQVSEKDLAMITHATESYRRRSGEYRANLKLDPR